MPILSVRGLPQRDPVRVSAALQATCLRIAEKYGCEPRQVWATWQGVQPGFYVEGDVAANVQPAESHPPIASLTCFEGKSAEVIADVLLAAAKTLSESSTPTSTIESRARIEITLQGAAVQTLRCSTRLRAVTALSSKRSANRA